MRRRITHIVLIIISICCVTIALFFLYIHLVPSTILPTKSSPNTLSIVRYSGPYGFPNKPVITLKQYVNGSHICNYTLEIKAGVFIQEPQWYELPKLNNGQVEIDVKFGDEMSSGITLIYDDAQDFYQEGVLIYFANFSIPHVYFVSGKETTCYSRATDTEEWTNVTDFPSLKAIPADEGIGWVTVYSGWKENKWVVEESGS